MKERDRKTAIELKRRLSASVPLLDLRVFGSRARGDLDEYSDMDVFVLVETLNKELKQKIRNIVWEVGFENFILISPLIFTKDEIENTPLRSSQIVRNISEMISKNTSPGFWITPGISTDLQNWPRPIRNFPSNT
jgi:uncharacterized protein